MAKEIAPIQIDWRHMHSVTDNPPLTGTLCIVYFPVAENQLDGSTFGPIAAAYKTDHGWKMADTPSSLRGLLAEVGPTYWLEILTM